ncbi:Helix-turn-helix domain-containing protein [Paenibacillus algorifonticola]|uniref:Helix-turn-helix domain-containing protein n=1 Tax=Paenibacillus algorifonticola TaxID=684063 RepID=A0A1I2IZ98_9BACL|nr:helix-turn-helix transcriptional regulator [Paenibacillus algorifonticola]SFF47519.1 Helix-turn-helix domain-containing protein [Paenibacillus algorifonticola]
MAVPLSKLTKIPRILIKTPTHQQRILRMNGLSAIESCTRTEGATGTLFLEDHMLLFVMEGMYTVRFGTEVHTVNKHEMVLIHKSIAFQYEKSGEPNFDYVLNYMMFFLKDELINEFMKLADYTPTSVARTPAPVSVHTIDDRLFSYLESLKPYFNEPERIRDGLVKVKLLELLFGIADRNDIFLSELAQIKRQERKSIKDVVDANITNPVTLHDLAYLSGRSLSSFKRDFKAIYNTSPLQWIRNRRLDKAQEMLIHSSLSVTEICFSTGFENVSHFSKVFKLRFGIPPSALKQPPKL